MNPLETYIRDIRDIRSSGQAVPETSYYPALSSLLNEIGRTLKPKVRCIINLKNRGAGIPDGGLFTTDQFQKASEYEPLPGQIPSRGVIEVKGTGDDVWVTADGKQVSRYWGKYRQVLVTNLRDFVLVGQDAENKPAKLEIYRLAESESSFWAAAVHPHKMAEVHGERFMEYLKRVLLHDAPLAAPKDVAWFLASYARDAKARIETLELPALATVRAALEEALGLKFEGEKGERFFRSTLVQTLFYGVFSAWVLWCKQHPPAEASARFDWRTASWSLHVPMIRALFEQLTLPSKLEPLGLVEVLNWTAAALNRVDRASFFSQFEEGHAVQYFYEPFLQAFDPALRKELGVWFTPPEIVQYMVARVDTVLREELGLEDGLANPQVYVLDPCCGTGAYLVEVLKHIAATLKERGPDALTADDVKQVAMKRVFGFEILPAPFVVAHLQLGLLLQNLGAPFSDSKNERAGVYLTNALTGWEPLDPTKEKAFQAMLTGFPELLEERDHARDVKQSIPILVILGNPPYNGFAGISPEEEQGLVEPYKQGLKEWGITKNYLDDLYVRFLRLAERRIAEVTGKGIVCYISNFSYLSDPSFVVMRRRFQHGFDSMWFDCMNGDSRETGKLTPEGKPDPSVFSTEYNREGIRVGTAIALMVRKPNTTASATVRFRHFWGVNKRADLLDSLTAKDLNDRYALAEPEIRNRFSFRPSKVAEAYGAWPGLSELASVAPMLGLNDNRGQATHALEKDEISRRMIAYYDPVVPFEAIATLHPGLATDAASFNARETRVRLHRESGFKSDNLTRFWFKPFDLRWAYIERTGNLWNRVRPELLNQAWPGNGFLLARRHAPKSIDGATFFFAKHISDQHALHTDAYFFPVRLRLALTRKNGVPQASFLSAVDMAAPTITANLSTESRTYLAMLGIPDPDANAETAGLIWMHALAIGYAPAYLMENADGIQRDWPRVPLPAGRDALLASAKLGKKIAALLDTEDRVPGVTLGPVRPELRLVGVISRAGGGTLDPAVNLAVTAGWGHPGQDRLTMPGKGKLVRRSYTPGELDAIRGGTEALDLTMEQAIQHLGEATYDIYLNDTAYWTNVPEAVWRYVIGGYQVIKKWLSYRELDLLGRALTADEVREVTNIARRIASILLLEPALDKNYRETKSSCYPWPNSDLKL